MDTPRPGRARALNATVTVLRPAGRYRGCWTRPPGAVRKHAWKYRDYVIKAFNEDKPFDRFIQEQIAGDLLPPGDSVAWLRRGEGLVGCLFGGASAFGFDAGALLFEQCSLTGGVGFSLLQVAIFFELVVSRFGTSGGEFSLALGFSFVDFFERHFLLVFEIIEGARLAHAGPGTRRSGPARSRCGSRTGARWASSRRAARGLARDARPPAERDAVAVRLRR